MNFGFKQNLIKTLKIFDVLFLPILFEQQCFSLWIVWVFLHRFPEFFFVVFLWGKNSISLEIGSADYENANVYEQFSLIAVCFALASFPWFAKIIKGVTKEEFWFLTFDSSNFVTLKIYFFFSISSEKLRLDPVSFF